MFAVHLATYSPRKRKCGTIFAHIVSWPESQLSVVAGCVPTYLVPNASLQPTNSRFHFNPFGPFLHFPHLRCFHLKRTRFLVLYRRIIPTLRIPSFGRRGRRGPYRSSEENLDILEVFTARRCLVLVLVT